MLSRINKSILVEMAGKYNPKNVVRHYNNNNYNNRPPRFNNNKIKIFVRDFPNNERHGLDLYKASKLHIENELIKMNSPSTNSWINEFDYFKSLHNKQYIKDPSIESMINKYIEKIESFYKSENKTSSAQLNKKIEDFNHDWSKRNSSRPVPDITKFEQRLESIKTADDLEKDYYSDIKDIKKSHIPIIYCQPKTTNFNYLTNAIKLITSNNTICFSFDIEAFERDNNVVTEIGISIYDPRENTHSVNPLIRSYHLIVSEAVSLINKSWVCDMKECFLLGESFVLTLSDCVQFIQSLINFYMIPNSETDKTWNRAFVGHSIDGDFKWLQSLGVKIPSFKSLDTNDLNSLINENENNSVFVLDTLKLYCYCYGREGGSLGKILKLFQLPHAFLHNAGNDSYYTLKLLLHLCDINTRIHSSLDDIGMIQKRIKNLLRRAKEEPKVLPMSYSITLKNVNRGNQMSNNNRGKPKKDLVPQTEFGGSQWYPDARTAFESTIQSKKNIFDDIPL